MAPLPLPVTHLPAADACMQMPAEQQERQQQGGGGGGM